MILTRFDSLPPVIHCTLCRLNEARLERATHHYVNASGRCYCCGPCAAHVTRLAGQFPKVFPVPAPLTEPPATLTARQSHAA